MGILIESSFNTEVLTEETKNGEKCWMIEGIFMQSDVVNRNRRIYPLAIMEKEINKYNEEYVVPKRAVGELSHPDTPSINFDRVTHLIENIKQDGKNFYGKARILNTPSGNIVKGLLEGGVKLGVSSRGMGNTKKNGQGIDEVQDFKLAAVDIVFQPSAPDAFVEALMEGEKYIWDTITEDHAFVNSLKEDVKKADMRNLQEAKIKAFEKFLSNLRNSQQI